MKTRIDKIFSDSNIMSRSETKAAVRKGRIALNGNIVRSSDEKAEDGDIITLDGKEITRRNYFYIMMNKPRGYVCSTDDRSAPTVLELISESDRHPELFPAGRLDKDTVGFLLITNDGALAHDLLSPTKHVGKTYYFHCLNPLSESDRIKLENGVDIGESEPTKKAVINIENEIGKSGTICITEGKFHQIKRMFKAVGNEITYLKRTTFGGLSLDETLSEGQYRHFTEEEVAILKSRMKN